MLFTLNCSAFNGAVTYIYIYMYVYVPCHRGCCLCRCTQGAIHLHSHLSLRCVPLSHTLFHFFYRSPTKLREGNVFADVCHSVHNGGRAITQCVLPLCLIPQTIPHGTILTSRTIPPSGPNPWYYTPVPYHLP